jgi:hypothetical protein
MLCQQQGLDFYNLERDKIMNGEWARLLGGGDRGFFENTVKTSVWRK